MGKEVMKNLIVIRCGDQSLHPQWIGEQSNFDVALSYFGNECPYDLSNITYFHQFKGSKWEGLYDFFLNHQTLLLNYDYIWLPDDDLSTTSQNINYFFQLVEQYQFSLAQPALTHNSYFSHAILLQVQGFIYRNTNFVEVMAPCFSREAFLQCWQTFSENKSGWGLDALWPNLLKNKNIGVIDITPIFHTRPVGIAGHGMGNDKDSPQYEYHQLCKKYNLKMKQGCYGGLLANEKYVRNKQELVDLIVAGCARNRVNNRNSFSRLYNEVMHPERFIG